MAVKKVYIDLDGRFVNNLLNWRITNLTTAQRNQLATQLGAANIALPVFDTNANSLFIWGGSTWLPVGGSTDIMWGNIIGHIDDQIDLITILNEKVDSSSLAEVAFSGDYNDLINTPGQLRLTTTGTTGVATLIGNDLNIPNYTAPSGYTLPPATYSSLGGIIVGSNLWVNSSGLLNLQGSGVTSALGYTPYNATNPAGYITGITAVMIDNALGYTPLDPSGTSAQHFAGN